MIEKVGKVQGGFEKPHTAGRLSTEVTHDVGVSLNRERGLCTTLQVRVYLRSYNCEQGPCALPANLERAKDRGNCLIGKTLPVTEGEVKISRGAVIEHRTIHTKSAEKVRVKRLIKPSEVSRP